MKKKLLGILVCMLLIATALPAVGTMIKQENHQDVGSRGGMFTQLPDSPKGWSEFTSYYPEELTWEDFWDITSPICSIHWWGEVSTIDWEPEDPIGMTFNIAFYSNDNGDPGDVVCSYSDISPEITDTGILYIDMWGVWPLYFFKYDLDSPCGLSEGWVSIQSTGSDYDCIFWWMSSSDGNDDCITTEEGVPTHYAQDLALVLNDIEGTNIGIENIEGGLGITLELKNNGAETVDNYPFDFRVWGGILNNIDVDVGETISSLNPGETMSVDTGMLLGFGKIKIFVIGDGIAMSKDGFQLFIFTIVQ